MTSPLLSLEYECTGARRIGAFAILPGPLEIHN